MKSTPTRPLVATLVALVVCSASLAFAQERPGGLFGGRTADRESRHKFDLTASLTEAHDSDTPVEFLAVDPVAALTSGYSTMLTGTGDYRWQGSTVQIGATGASAFRYFNNLEEIRSISHTGGLGLNARLGSRATLLLNGTAAYSPAYLFGLFPQESQTAPGAAIATAPDYATRDTESYAYGTALGLTYGLSRRSRITATGEFQYTDFVAEDAAQQDMNSRGIRAGYSRNLARRTVLNTGYGYRAGTSAYAAGAVVPDGDEALTTENSVGVGVDYSRPLSATRSFTLGVTVGSAAVKGAFPLDAGIRQGRAYRLFGDAALGYGFGRGWQVRGTFRRGLEFVAGLTEPVFIDGLTVSLAGLLTDRMDFAASTRYSSGESAINRTSLVFDTYGADARLRYALTRSVAMYAEYLYYFYDFSGDAAGLIPRLSAGLERSAVRAGVTLWVPVFRK